MEKVEVIKRENLGILVIQNPPFNTLSTPVLRELMSALEEMKGDPVIEVVLIERFFRHLLKR